MSRTGFLVYTDVQVVSLDSLIAPTDGISVGTNGDVSVMTAKGSIITLSGLTVGVIYPISVVQVNFSGTTASPILAYYI